MKEVLRIPEIRSYQAWLSEQNGLAFTSYDDLWRWSTTDLEGFWLSLWDYFDIESAEPFERVLAANVMPGAKWFGGARVNYARQVLRHVEPATRSGVAAIVARNESGVDTELSWEDLARQVASLAVHLRRQGLRSGDRVAVYMPNIPETVVAFLAVSSLGAIWSICAPDMGTAAVLDRFSQITPTMLIACDAVRYGGRTLDRRNAVDELRASLPTLRHVVLHRSGLVSSDPEPAVDTLTECLSQDDVETAVFEPLAVAFDHPLWIVYSSGTTGLPKPIVHGHGGIMLVMMAATRLHNDIGCSYAPESFGERYHWYSTTGWVMWNGQVAGLLSGTTCCLYDGSPGGSREEPDWTPLWRFASESRTTFFGAGAAFYAACRKAGVDIAACGSLAALRALGSTGSPLDEEVQRWISASLKNGRSTASAIRWCNLSGGTDFAGAFMGPHPDLPEKPGEMQCRLLGFAVESWDAEGRALIDEVGELMCTQPVPSMPLFLWGDDDGSRLMSSYFDFYPPGHGRHGGQGSAWRHGDWLRIKPDGACIIYGRSDATINRHGLRMGTSEIYSAVESIAEIQDSLVVDLEWLGRPSYMPLFVVLREGIALDELLLGRIRTAIRESLSARFLPDAIVQAPAIPRTLSNKKQEVPIRKLLLGARLEDVMNKGLMLNPQCLDWYQAFADGLKGR